MSQNVSAGYAVGSRGWNVGGPEQLIERWRAECLRLQKQKRSSTRLPRMYEMLMTMLTQLKGRHESGAAGS